MTIWMQEVPQIPWAPKVKVGHILSPSFKFLDGITLTKSKVKVTVMSHGIVFVNINSKDNIGTYLKKSPDLTRSLMTYFKKDQSEPSTSNFASVTMDWVKGEPIEPSTVDSPGVLDWFPGIEDLPKKIGKIAYYGSGRAKDAVEGWIGTPFHYVHFLLLPDVKAEFDDECIAILWEGSEKPEVYRGDVHGFMFANEESFEDWEAYRNYNDLMENGLLWALDEFGLFETDGLPKWAVQLVEHDPDLLWADLVARLLPIHDLLPADLERVLMVWVDRRRQEAEVANGQLRFWHYPGKQ